MPALTLYFQVHQPYRLRSYSYFDIGSDAPYFDETLNRTIVQRIARNCYIPTNALLKELIVRCSGKFRVAFSLSGTVVEQLRLYAPEALESFRSLVATGCVELLGETYYHSLAAIYQTAEFAEQVALHRRMLREEFGVEPRVFRNTELIYSDALAACIASLGFTGVLTEGADAVLGWRSPNQIFRAPGSELLIFPRNYKLSDDLAFRFTHPVEGQQQLTARVYAQWLHAQGDCAEAVGVFVDYETFGEHVGENSGIFNFLRELPDAVLQRDEWCFATPSEVMQQGGVKNELSYPVPTSWADTERDLSAWCGNELQRASLKELYSVAADSAQAAGGDLLTRWRLLQTSDHFYYMSTKAGGDGVVHSHFSPFESPYRAFIAYRNVLRDLNRSMAALRGNSS